jgi:hypothetical protein
MPASGPETAHSGQKVWATVLGGEYSDNADARLETPVIDLTRIVEPQLSFWHWYSFEYREARYDGANVKISVDGGEFQIITPTDGYEGIISSINVGIPGEPGFHSYEAGRFWHPEVFDLTPFSGHQIVIRFHFGSNWRHTYLGWYIDDVTVTGLRLIPQPVGVINLRAQRRRQDMFLDWSWPDEPAPTGFAIYRGAFSNEPLPEPQLVAIVTDTTYLDIAAAGDTSKNYYYQVRAIESILGEQSVPSEAVGEFDMHLINDRAR